jgi:guanylate kinase
VLPPSRDEQQRRLRVRGDAEDRVLERLRKAEDEEPVGMAMADHVVVNDDLERTIGEMLGIIEWARASRVG